MAKQETSKGGKTEGPKNPPFAATSKPPVSKGGKKGKK
jgi:hypothetical protein